MIIAFSFLRNLFFVICACFFIAVEAVEPGSDKKSICLNMVVKNNSDVIEACLASVKPMIDYWVIVDMGSDDGTQEIIKNCMKDIPGELHERPWVNFTQNRNEALSLAKSKGDYVLLINADEVFQCSEDFVQSFSNQILNKDVYRIPVREVGFVEVKRIGLINNHLDWWWEGGVYGAISCSNIQSIDILKGALILHYTEVGGVSRVVNHLQEAQELEKVLQEDPNNSRYSYLLAVSYMGAEKYELAKKNLERRIALPSLDLHETYLAMYFLGRMQEALGELDEALASYAKAYAFHPVRAEPLMHSARIHRQNGNLLSAYLLSKQSLEHPVPEEDPYVEYPIYDHVRLIEFVNCTLFFNKFKEALDACSELLANPNLPSEYRPQVLAIYELILNNLNLTKF